MGRVAKWPCRVQWAASVTHGELERTRGVFHKLTNWKWTEEPAPHLSPSKCQNRWEFNMCFTFRAIVDGFVFLV